MSSIKVGFIGLGNMGMPMAESLVKNGFSVTVYDLRQEAVEEIKSLGAKAASSCRAVAAASDVVISMVRDIPQTDEVILGKDGVWEGIKEGSTIIISSTLNPSYCQELYTRAKEKGIRVIDCAVSDPSGQRHRLGGLTLFIGGDEDAVKQCWPIFEAMGKNIFHLGGIGMGQACKLVHQLNAFNISTVTRESLNLGLKAGLDLRKMVEALSAGLGSTRGLQRMAAMLKSQRRTPAARPLVAQAPATIPPDANARPQIMGLNKDKQLAMEMAEAVGAEVPIARFMDELDPSLYETYSTAMRQYM